MGAFYARKEASQRHDHCHCGADDRAYGCVLGVSRCRDHLGGIPTLAAIGQQVGQLREPALLDNPIHMLISRMYLFAKLFVALGFRRDLAALLQKSSA